MKFATILTSFCICLSLCCAAQKKKGSAVQHTDLLQFDSSGNYTGAKRWTEFTKTKALSIVSLFGDTANMVLQKLNVLGNVAVQPDGTETKYKTGRWLTVVPGSPNLRLSAGNYSLGSFKKCCDAGYCTGYYSYKSGFWNFYYYTGKLMACGTFTTATVEINTGCSIQTIKKSRLSSDWKFYAPDGGEITPDKDVIDKIENYEIL